MKLGVSNLVLPVISVGCMRIKALSKPDAEKFIKTSLELGANFFDHADIYGGNGACEEHFADAIGMTPALRETMFLQTKCGIRRGWYDFSKEHILNSVDKSLLRLKTDYIDVLLLHRPDALVEPEEVAEAFDILYASGKVRHFGVSNQKPMQIQLLQKYLNQPIVANQLQLSVMNTTMIASGINVNTAFDSAVDRDGSILDFCRLNDITIQPWSPFQYGCFEGVYLDNDKFPEVNAKINEIAAKYNVTNNGMVIAWLLRHPAKMQPVTGTMNIQRLKEICDGVNVTITREEWYEIYRSAGNKIP